MSTPEAPLTSERPLSILLVEDEPDVAALLARLIQACGAHRVRVETAPTDLPGLLTESRPDLVLTDLMMPGLDGFDVLRAAHAFDLELPVIVVSAHASLDNAVAAVKAGAFDFLAKPFGLESVELMLAKARREADNRDRQAALCRAARARDGDLNALLGDSPVMRRLRDWIAQVRAARASVLIEGESGTGKELVARALHSGQGPFVALNVAAIPDELAKAELFAMPRAPLPAPAATAPASSARPTAVACFSTRSTP